jgi:hypothetical protein
LYADFELNSNTSGSDVAENNNDTNDNTVKTENAISGKFAGFSF